MLDISPALLVSTLVLFIFLVYYLNKFLYVPLLNYMEKRDSDLKKDLEEASSNAADVGSLKEEAEKILATARLEATSIKDGVVEATKSEIEAKLSEKKKELESAYSEFSKSLQDEKEKLKTALLSNSSLFEDAIKNRFAKI
jgi:F-type H+-transporting ATPase subunit b